MSQAHILMVDDNQDIRELLSTYLSQHDYQVSSAENGEQMRHLLSRGSIDLIVLDLMMPGEDGLSLCRHVREVSGPPVIMLTAMSEDADCVVGLEMGADDYVTKPFVPRVLLARIKAVLRRKVSQDVSEERLVADAGQWRFQQWSLDGSQRQLIRKDGVLVPLSTAEFKLLEVFLQHPQRVLSRDQLLSFTKGREAEPFDRSIDNQVSRLRKKVEEDPQNPTLIKTVWGGGYMFSAVVTR
ncbi:response regulator [Aestuariicella hydrocarbonica]|uniref:Response regulator n=1 Tax=Pseudomaricurvus hydrocarbonicus TaxID=1470433 RepID=A0A9E5JR04_9GAMM|nr:response regulator [Aestuariicella hydrocarbonica]NHO65127.1 response regulator [Aestuariicella hydrocarbonica]